MKTHITFCYNYAIMLVQSINRLLSKLNFNILEIIMTNWTKCSATEMRFGFEVTMYVNNR